MIEVLHTTFGYSHLFAAKPMTGNLLRFSRWNLLMDIQLDDVPAKLVGCQKMMYLDSVTVSYRINNSYELGMVSRYHHGHGQPYWFQAFLWDPLERSQSVDTGFFVSWSLLRHEMVRGLVVGSVNNAPWLLIVVA